MRQRRDIPYGLNSAIIKTWLSGVTETANSEHLDYVLKLWNECPSIIEITATMRKAFEAELSRTGMSYSAVLRQCDPTEASLDAQVLSRIKNQKRKTIEKDVWQHLMSSLASAPTKNTQSKKPCIGRNHGSGDGENYGRDKRGKKVHLTQYPADLRFMSQADIEKLKHHRERSGVGATELLRLQTGNKPPSVSTSTITRWINGYSKRASNADLIWVLNAWAKLPDK